MTGIVERLRDKVPMIWGDEGFMITDDDTVLATFKEAADEIERLRTENQELKLQYLSDQGQWIEETGRLRAELHEAHGYAGQLAVSLRRKHFSELPPFELQSDLYGRLTQIDNMTCGMTRAALGEKE